MRRRRLYLFVWTEVLTDYTDGLVCALAHDKAEALELIRAELDSDLGYREVEIGEPDVYDAPVAVHVWGGG